MNAKIIRARGRPRAFDAEAALATGQRLFHAHGYADVGLATLTEALGIKPPSFYAAFGSKAAFFERVLDRYANSVLTLQSVLRPGRGPAAALAELLDAAARTYAADPEARGCLVLEAARGNDDGDSAAIARRIAEPRRAQMRDFVARTHPAQAAAVVDYMVSTMSGLSASAREGMDERRLVAIARVAAEPLRAMLPDV